MGVKAAQTKTNRAINQNRLWADLMALAKITEAGSPYTRRSFSNMFLKGRQFLTERFLDAGLEVSTDTHGNLIGRFPGKSPKIGTIVIGSHSDTVPNGGRFDGVAGVVAGLEIARALRDSGLRLQHNLEVMDCLAEEMSEYGLSCVGSRGITGFLETGMLEFSNACSETLGEAIARMGGNPSESHCEVRQDIAAYLELHIEQGRVLQAADYDIGIVTAIVGITRLELVIDGRADHAGTAPMNMRRDALNSAAELILGIRDMAAKLSTEGYFVATTGEITVEPNAANVVPSQVKLVIDARAEHRGLMDRFLDFVRSELPDVAKSLNTTLSEIGVLSDSPETTCDNQLIGLQVNAADELGLRSMKMTSGAGHDAVFFSRIAPTALVFVPSKDGRSHCPEEWSEPDQLAIGAEHILRTVLKIDASPKGVIPGD